MTREERNNAMKVLRNFDLNNPNVNSLLFSAEEITNAFDMAIKTLEQELCWIPVSERLPKSNGVYVVSRWFSDGEESVMLTDANYYDGNGDWYNDNRINWGRDLVTDKIVAWMPLPTPYKADSEGVSG